MTNKMKWAIVLGIAFGALCVVGQQNIPNAFIITGSLPAGTNVIGHVIADTGSTTAVTALPAIPSGANVIGHVIADSGSTTAVTALPAIPAGANVIGHVIADSGSTTAVTSLPAGNNPCVNPVATLQSVALNASGTTAVQIVALSGSTKIYVCSVTVQGGGTTPTFSLVQGTGVNCASGQTVYVGTLTLPASQPVIIPSPIGASVAGNALCTLLTGTSPTGTGVLSFVQQN